MMGIRSDFFVIRRPLLPVHLYQDLHRRHEEGVALADLLRTVYEQAIVQEALYYASPDVHTQLMDCLTEPREFSPRLLATLYKYFIRMATRSTPFGLFAGVALGSWGTETRIRMSSDAAIRKTVQLDSHQLDLLLEAFLTHPDVQEHMRWVANPTSYQVGEELRYIQYEQVQQQRSYLLQSTALHPILYDLWQQSRSGVTGQTLSDVLAAASIDADTAESYIQTLINHQVLLPDIGLTLTNSPLETLRERLLPYTNAFDSTCEQLLNLLKEGSIAGCEQVKEVVAQLAPPEPRLVQCDTAWTADELTLDTAWLDTLWKQLQGIVPLIRTKVPPNLTDFRERFYARYQDQAIPLLEALDPDAGIGYGSSLVTSPWLEEMPGTASPPATDKPVPDWIQNGYLRTLHGSSNVWQLSDTELPEGKSVHWPASSFLLGSWLVENEKPYFHLQGIGGPTALQLLGRFGHVAPELTEALVAHARMEAEAYPDAVLAEIIHLPEARTGNVLRRPLLRAYEIPLLTSSELPEDQQLAMDDLLVSVVQGQRIELWSKRLGKRVIPRLSTAHNFATGLAHYRFLCDLQYEENSLQFKWDWAGLDSAVSLPRVVYKQLILSRAQWTLLQTDVSGEFRKNFQRWCQTYRVPRWVYLAEDDNELLLDLQTEMAQDILESTLRKSPSIRLIEMLHTEQNNLFQGNEQWHHELVIPLYRAVQYPSGPPPAQSSSAPQRVFHPGDAWTYVKLYLGEQAQEHFLREQLPDLLNHLEAQQLGRCWFFVRFADPEPHLRFRFYHPDGPRLLQTVLAWLKEWALPRIQLDSYDRELERYGPERMEACEHWFHQESEWIVSVLPLFDADEWQRLAHAVAVMAAYLRAWALPEQIAFLEKGSEAFRREFDVGDQALFAMANRLYREQRTLLLDACMGQLDGMESYPEIPDTEAFRPIAGDLIHMAMNRLFVTDQRRHELMVYHLTLLGMKTVAALKKSGKR